jgi:hypothetical protein
MKTLRFATFALAFGIAASFVTAPVAAVRAEAQVFTSNTDPRLALPLIGTVVGVGVAAAVCGPVTPICLWQGAGWGLLGGAVTNEVFGRPLFFRPAHAVQPVYYEPPRKRKKRKKV